MPLPISFFLVVYVATRWSLVISTCICTKVETKRVHTGFCYCIPSVDLRHYCLVTCTIERRKINQVQLQSRTRAALYEQSKLKRERKSFWVFQRLNKSKRKEKYFCCF